MASAPEGPGEDEGYGGAEGEKDAGEKGLDLRDGGNEALDPRQTAGKLCGLLSFALSLAGSKADRLRSAASLARKAAAAMTSVMWRCQPCQERASQ